MKIIIAGATGLIGEALIKRLLGKHEIVLFTRDVPRARKQFEGAGIHFADWHQPPSHLAALIEGSRSMINLAGVGIGDQRWSQSRKQAILGSRLQTVEALYQLISAAEIRLDVVIQASATGFYGSHPSKSFSEADASGDGFLAEVSKKWENAAQKFDTIASRLVIIRTGVVLAAEGGALPKMALPFRFFAGGRLGAGNQWISWIDIEDEVEAILHLLFNTESKGVYNLTAPEPIQQWQMAKAIGKALKRPAFIPTPSFVLRLILGQMADELLLTGNKVLPDRLLAEGFKFHFSKVETSVEDKLR